MNKLTIYSKNFDDYSYTVGRGMSGKVFIENGKTGKEFRSAEDAIDFAVKANVLLAEIVYNFQMNGHQYFKTFKLEQEHAAPPSSNELSAVIK